MNVASSFKLSELNNTFSFFWFGGRLYFEIEHFRLPFFFEKYFRFVLFLLFVIYIKLSISYTEKEKGLFIQLENMPTTKFFFKCIRKILTWFYITCYTLICTLLFQSSWMHGENNKEKELLMIFFVSQTILSFLFQDFL